MQPALPLAALALLLAAGCHRSVRGVLGDDRRGEAGLELSWGALDAHEREWDFGDGSPRATGRRVSHACARSGLYHARAFERGQLVDKVEVAVVARAVSRATPLQP